MKPSNPASTTDIGRPLDANFLDGLADALEVQEERRRSFKETVQEAAREFQAGRASPKVDVLRREIGSLAKVVAKVLNKPTQEKREALRWRLDKLSPEATDYLLRHHPPHDRSNPPWGAGELSRGQLEELYALCCRGSNYRGQYQHAAGLIMRCHEAGWSPTKIHDEIKGAIERKWLKPQGLRPGYPSERAIRYIIRREEAEATERRLDIKYGPVKEPGPPLDHPKRALYAQLGLAFHEGTGTYPKRKDIVFMTDHVLNQLGEPVKQNRGGNDTDLARDYLRVLRESHRD